MPNDYSDRVRDVAQSIAPLLKGIGIDVQGGVLSDLCATFIAAHLMINPDGSINREKTDQAREIAIETLIECIRTMIPVNEKIVLAQHKMYL